MWRSEDNLQEGVFIAVLRIPSDNRELEIELESLGLAEGSLLTGLLNTFLELLDNLFISMLHVCMMHEFECRHPHATAPVEVRFGSSFSPSTESHLAGPDVTILMEQWVSGWFDAAQFILALLVCVTLGM